MNMLKYHAQYTHLFSSERRVIRQYEESGTAAGNAEIARRTALFNSCVTGRTRYNTDSLV